MLQQNKSIACIANCFSEPEDLNPWAFTDLVEISQVSNPKIFFAS